MIDLTASQTFTNDAATGTATFSKTGAPLVATAARANLTVAYDAPSRGYTITTGGRSQVFRPGDVDAAQSSAGATVYLRTNGATTDSLTLTRPATSGRLTYQYVGAGFWQRTVDGASAVNGSFDAFTYGFPTADGALPRSGRAEFAIDLLGVESVGDNIVALAGSGLLQVDFASGNVLADGKLDPAFSLGGVAGRFSSISKLSASANTFAGSFSLYDVGTFTGSLNGRFYGPVAQEIGAVFAATESGGRAIAGTLTGRGGAVTAANATLEAPTISEFFTGNTGTVTATLAGTSGSNNSAQPFSGRAQTTGALTVNYDALSQTYTLISATRSQYFGSDVVSPGSSGDVPRVDPSVTAAWAGTAALQNLRYVSGSNWRTAAPGAGNTDYTIDFFSYGIKTSDAALPRTGSAGFAIGLFGSAADSDYPNLVNFTGLGALTANFSSGAIAYNGTLAYREDYTLSGRAPAQPSGSFTGTGTLSSSTNLFTGSISLTGIGNYSGGLNGRFYGPSAQEVGGAFSASDGAGGVLSGALVGGRDAALSISGKGLLDLTDPITFGFVALAGRVGFAGTESYGNTLAYDPAARRYAITLPDRGGSPVVTTSFGASDVVPARTNATYTGYAVSPAGTGSNLTALVFNPGSGNPKLVLTYTSFADVVFTQTSPDTDYRYFFPFGIVTPPLQMPRSGTGSYSGIAYGNAKYSGNPLESAVDGVATLNADFAGSTFSSVLTLRSIAPETGVATALSPFTYSGNINANNFVGSNAPGGDFSGQLTGQFFGPAANEIGGVFRGARSGGPGAAYEVYGVIVGKRD